MTQNVEYVLKHVFICVFDVSRSKNNILLILLKHKLIE